MPLVPCYRGSVKHVRFLKEARPAAPLTVYAGLAASDSHRLTLYAEVCHSLGGEVMATLLTEIDLVGRDGAPRPVSPSPDAPRCTLPEHRAPRCTLPEHGAPRGIKSAARGAAPADRDAAASLAAVRIDVVSAA